jgi:multimeric flavodoxin WrbA
MLVLGVSGSPRRGGNTEILLDEALAAAGAAGAETKKIVLPGLKYSSCMACGACENTGICIQKDDMQEIYEMIGAADAMIFSSPIYFYAVSGWSKCAIDRAQALWARKYRLKDPRYTGEKKGYSIFVGATRGARLFDGARLTMKYFYDAAGFVPSGDVAVNGIDEKGDIRQYPQHMEAARRLGAAAACRDTIQSE